jgi:hypothetical protein
MKGYRFAVGTLVLELILALGLLSDSTAIVSMLLMVFVGVAWLPAGWMLFTDARNEEVGNPGLAFVVAIACGLAGGLCLLTVLKWIGLTVATTSGAR